MRVSRRTALTCLLPLSLAMGCAPTQPASNPPGPAPASGIMGAFGQATAAIRAVDFATAETHFETALQHAPGHPVVIEQLMRVNARMRDTAGVLKALRQLAPIGTARTVRGDSIYNFMLPHNEFDRLVTELSAKSAPLIRSDTAAAIPDEDLLVESIALRALSDNTQELVLGSASTSRILAAPLATSRTRTIAEARGRVLGIKVDERGRVWANVWFPNPPGDSTAPPNRSELLVISPASGRIERAFQSPVDGSPHLFNDVAFDSRGHAYFTDTEAHRIYRVSTNLRDEAPREFGPRSGEFTAPNGIAAAADGRSLYVAHVEGVSHVSLVDGARTLVRSVPGVPTNGIDGLYACGRALIAVQNVVGMDRITWFDLSSDGMSITGGTVLEQRHPAYREPTTGVVAGDRFYYVATSDVARQRAAGPLLPATGPRNTVILRLKLPRTCS